MNIHKLARTTPASRALIAARRTAGMTEAMIAAQLGIDRRTVRKWHRRASAEGPSGLTDRSSRPLHMPTALDDGWQDAIVALRRLRFTQSEIADKLGLSKSRVQRIAAAKGHAKLRDLEPPEPVVRYQRDRPGELVHVDTKKLGKFFRPGHRVTGDRKSSARLKGRKGWEFLHIAIDDRTRLAYAELLPDERGFTCAAFIRRAVAFYARHGIKVERVMSDNGCGYKLEFSAALNELGIIHKRTRPYTPKTNGKAERFIQTLLRLWAYVRPYNSSDERAAALPPWLHWYNRLRPHGSLDGHCPVDTLKQLRRDNLVGDHS